MEQANAIKLATAGLVAAGLAAGGFFAGQGLVESRLGFRTVTVKGLAEREVKADLGFWPVRFTATGPTLEAARQSLEASETAVSAFLREKGFPASALQVQGIQVEDRIANLYQSGGSPDARFVLTETLLVRSTEVDKLAEASRDIGGLLRAGVVFSGDSYSGGPSFTFTGLNAMKGELLAEATERAREAAAEFAKESGARVGAIQTANQGIISIEPAVEIPNSNADAQIDKKVRVVTTITYFLK
jgi:uncharacterized protein